MKKNVHKIPNTKYLILTALFLAAFLERAVFDLGPNFELVTTAMILSSYYFGKKESFWLTFAVVALSDRLIGNSSIFLFTWTGFLLPAFFASNVIKIFKEKVSKFSKTSPNLILKLILLTGAGLTANIFFYLWSNFGVWFLDSFHMYPDSLAGLVMSYVNGLPFLKYQLISTILLLPATLTTVNLVKSTLKYLRLNSSPAQI